jgi:hypothetical protein
MVKHVDWMASHMVPYMPWLEGWDEDDRLQGGVIHPREAPTLVGCRRTGGTPAGERQQMMVVWLLPPRDCCRMRVGALRSS